MALEIPGINRDQNNGRLNAEGIKLNFGLGLFSKIQKSVQSLNLPPNKIFEQSIIAQARKNLKEQGEGQFKEKFTPLQFILEQYLIGVNEKLVDGLNDEIADYVQVLDNFEEQFARGNKDFGFTNDQEITYLQVVFNIFDDFIEIVK